MPNMGVAGMQSRLASAGQPGLVPQPLTLGGQGLTPGLPPVAPVPGPVTPGAPGVPQAGYGTGMDFPSSPPPRVQGRGLPDNRNRNEQGRANSNEPDKPSKSENEEGNKGIKGEKK